MKTIYEIRLDNARIIESAISRPAMAEKMDMGYGLLSNYIGKTPKKNIGDDVARRMEDAGGKPKGWLDQNHEAREITPDDWQRLLDAHATAAITNDELTAEEIANKVWVDVVDVSFSCGDGEDIEFHYESIETRKLSFDASFFTKRGIKKDNAKFAYVTGRSMEPFLFDGDVFGFDTTDTAPKDGQVYAVYFGGEAMLKQIFIEGEGKLTLHSYNPDWRDKTVDESNGTDFKILGRQFWRAG